jgi:hypothetical protein
MKKDQIIPSPSAPLPHAAGHKMVVDTAREMAAVMYQEMAVASNQWYAMFKDQDAYVEASWPLFLESARTTLAKLLTTNISENLKTQIHEALCMDNALRNGRGIQIAT